MLSYEQIIVLATLVPAMHYEGLLIINMMLGVLCTDPITYKL